MRSVIISSVLILAASSSALPQDFQASFQQQASGSIEVGRIDFSDELRAKADHLGPAELSRLATYLREDLERSLIRTRWLGVAVEETTLNVTIVDARPNRPTISQIQALETAQYTDASVGGAQLEAELLNADGSVIATFSYIWDGNSSEDNSGYGIWTDARHAFRLFSESLADSLGLAPMPTS